RRNHISVYYNENELGLGRELGCSTFEDRDSSGMTLSPPGIACYVTNYGEAINDPNNAIIDAIQGSRPKNSVCIAYQPSLPAGYQVNFVVYDGAGRRSDTAALDYFGRRPVPGICTNCHGRVYDASRHLVAGGRFLPVHVLEIKYIAAAPYRHSHQNHAF